MKLRLWPKPADWGQIVGVGLVLHLLHDLHAWTITSGMNALSAHLVLEKAEANGSVLTEAQRLLQERFEVDHSTLQIEPPGFNHAGKVHD